MQGLRRSLAALGACAALSAPLAWADPDRDGEAQQADCAAEGTDAGPAAESAGTEGATAPTSPEGSREVPPPTGSTSGLQPAGAATSVHITPDIAASGLDCASQALVAAANAYVATRPGTLGFVIRDRATGATYHSQRANALVFTASTIKLLIATDLLVRQRAGALTLTEADKTLMHQMLNYSDNGAANALWDKYNGPGGRLLLQAFQQYGFLDEIGQGAPSATSMYWGNHLASPDDLGRLMLYILERMDPEDSAYLVNEMRQVSPNQQWGVWGAGAAMAPGDKNGWAQESSGWVTNSVGFAGPGARYVLAIMNNLGTAGGQTDGFTTTTQVASILLSGRAD